MAKVLHLEINYCMENCDEKVCPFFDNEWFYCRLAMKDVETKTIVDENDINIHQPIPDWCPLPDKE